MNSALGVSSVTHNLLFQQPVRRLSCIQPAQAGFVALARGFSRRADRREADYPGYIDEARLHNLIVFLLPMIPPFE
jgi:hypothetical protein